MARTTRYMLILEALFILRSYFRLLPFYGALRRSRSI